MKALLLFLASDPLRPAALWLLLMGLVLFCAMGLDKRRAQRGARRIPEARLFLLAALGGAAGGWLGMYVFRHKTRRLSFVLGFPLLGLLHLALCLLLLRQSA